MAKLIYSALMSLDGYVADRDGRFDWAMPDAQVHSFVNELERSADTYLYGRRMYEVMVAWETLGDGGDEPDYIVEYARQWRAASKIVFSTTLREVGAARTRIEPSFDPGMVRELKSSSDGDLSIGGPTLAAQAIAADLVDEYQLIVAPVLVGGGLPAFPVDLRLDLELVDQRAFGNGMIYLNYRSRG